ncbi:COX15/CtaA family protein [Actinocrinis puniceicyclus]|uniref:COX15/CtaA family protein n=1 Tax=Actinocrinis puniceicyclus TaxID=977794 RepID=A0A8J8BAN0_9ACTN|nr:COX15/CtaA family protein [Actinocrinis puniceicyclus]MBS2961570.1 COX15/CtaA family protein [Actinocrinis puniceicyclus]
MTDTAATDTTATGTTATDTAATDTTATGTTAQPQRTAAESAARVRGPRVLLRRPSARTVQLVCLAALIVNTGIVVTGGAVRLTNSGLGCPTWPECTAGSLVPVPSLGYHGVIEFSNRLLTYVVTAAAGLALVATARQRPRRPVLVRYSWALVLGVFAQAVIGGISVRTQLAPGWVAFHFAFSMGMIAIAWLLWVRSREGDGPARPLLRRELIWLARTLVTAAGAVVVVGTLVTGAGPHAGALDAARRLPLKPVEITQAHADLVFIVVGLTVALWFALKAIDAPAASVRATRDLFLVLVAQGAIGYTQYFTALPSWLVLLHMTGACLTWIAAWRVLTSMRVRPQAAPAAV